MPLPPLLKQLIIQKFSRYCNRKTPSYLKDRKRVTYKIFGNKVTLFESQVPEDNAVEWIEDKIAQIRYDHKRNKWTLFWPDQNKKWYRYTQLNPTKKLDRILLEIDKDPTYIFWG